MREWGIFTMGDRAAAPKKTKNNRLSIPYAFLNLMES